MYKVLEEGEGRFHPKPDTSCDCHYKGNLVDGPSSLGKQFDSSYDRGETSSFAPNEVIKGWTEAMQLMVEGDKWEMYIPSALGYGDSGDVSGTLVFTMELVKINGDSVATTRPVKVTSAAEDEQEQEALAGESEAPPPPPPKRKTKSTYVGQASYERKRARLIKKVCSEVGLIVVGVLSFVGLLRWRKGGAKGGRRRGVKVGDLPTSPRGSRSEEPKQAGKKKDGRRTGKK